MRSLAAANLQQRQNNFKDKSITLYPGKTFKEFLDDADDLFCSLPPPLPSRTIRNPKIDVRKGDQFASVYNNADAGCFTADSTVSTKNGEDVKRCADVRKGDSLLVMTGDCRHYATVDCVIEIKINSGTAWLTELAPNATSSMWHPVLLLPNHKKQGTDPKNEKNNCDQKWVFPWQLEQAKTTSVGFSPKDSTNGKYETLSLFNFIFKENKEEQGHQGPAALSPVHAVFIGGYPYAALAHEIQDNPCVTHRYFGTNKVVQDIMAEPAYSSGYVVYDNTPYTRSSHTGIVDGMRASVQGAQGPL
eukprot:3932472-Rhodomonas_salina.1